MKIFTIVVSWLFGLLLISLSLFVAAETLSRKLFNISFQGADELGGYVLAIGGALSFTVALLERGHIRIDMLYDFLGSRSKAVLNWLSAIALAVLGLFFARYCWPVVRDTIAYGSTAPTAWATPMIIPQSIWYGCMLIFTIAGLLCACKASRQLFSGNLKAINESFHPKGALEELDEELSDIQRR